jgi:hypothetical protein
MGYHQKEIKRGVYGEFSKIKEEFEEAEDAFIQENPIMLLLELSDLLGAVEKYCSSKYNIELEDLMKMKNATKSAFEDGIRQSRK